MNKNNPIGLVDSGVGGLTVVKEALKKLPNEQFIFIGDTARMPYGTKTKDQVISYTLQMAEYLVNVHHIKMLVIACNTATACALDGLQKKYDIPIIGVIQPGAKAAVRATNNNKIGVIATQGTVDSGAYETTIKQCNINMTVLSQAEPDFVQFVEKNQYHDEKTNTLVQQHLRHLKASGIDTLVLGCTHFPLLAPFIQQGVGESVQLIDAGGETVQSICDTLQETNLSATQDYNHENDVYYTTSLPQKFKTIANDWLMPNKALDVRHLDILGNGEQQHLEESHV